MGLSLDYRTNAAVPSHLQLAIQSEAAQIAAPSHGWWSESLYFFDPSERDGRLYGSAKIFLIGYSNNDGTYVEVDPDEDSLMAYRDTCFILEILSEWSRKHGVSWEVACAGEPIGAIKKGQWDSQLREYVDGMKTSFPWPSSFEDEVTSISEKYASRG
jgi:hypothetical protein